MNPDEEQYLKWIEEYKNGDQLAFERIWLKAKNLIDFSNFFDPSHARTRDDFEAIAKVKCFQSLFGEDKVIWKPNSGYSVISWIRNCMVRAVLREVKKIKREMKFSYIESYRTDDGWICFEEVNFNQVDRPKTEAEELDDNEIIKMYCKIINKRIEKEYPKILKTYHLKLAFPNIKVKTISTILGVSDVQIYHYLGVLKKVTKEVMYAHNINR